MKIIDNKFNKASNKANYGYNSPNFQSKKIITTVTNPNSLKFASAAATALGMSLIALSQKNNEDFSELEDFLSKQTVDFESGAQETAHTPQEIKLIVELFKENPELTTQMILMESSSSFVKCPRFKATGMKMMLNAYKENHELTEKLLNAGTIYNNEITEYTFSAEDIMKILELGKKQPTFIDKVINIKKENYDNSYSTRFVRAFEYEYLTKAHEQNSELTDYMLNVPNLRAADILEFSQIFKTADFFMELRNTLPEGLHYDADVIKGIAKMVKLVQTPVQNLAIPEKEYLLKLLTAESNKTISEILHKNIPNLDSKINQLKMALGYYKESINITSDGQNVFLKTILANNNLEAENVLKNFDFAQYGKNGLPLEYSRKDFIDNINLITEKLNSEEKDIVLQHFGIIPGVEDYDGLLTNKPFENQNVSENAQIAAKNIQTEIEKFTTKNKITTGDENADKVLNSILQGIPEFAFYIGKEQHGIQAYSVDIHTLKVLQGAMNNPEYSKLSDISKTVLKMAILMHDIGKKGKVVDSGHAALSSAYASAILEKFPFSEELKNKITEIIGNHHWSADYDTKNVTAETIAAYSRAPESMKMYEIFTQADIEAVNDSLYKMLYQVKNLDDFHSFFKNKMKPIHEAFAKMRSQSNFVFDTKILNNGENFPRESVEINGKQTELKVLNFSKLSAGESLQKYGFAPNVTKENARFLTHMTNRLENTMKLVKNSSNKVAWSTSLVKNGANNTVEEFGFIFNADQSNISIAYKENLSLGYRRNIQDFIKILFLEENDRTGFLQARYKEKRVFMRDSLMKELAEQGYKLTEKEYAELAEHITSKKHTSQFRKDIKIGNHIIKSTDLALALEKSLDVLFNDSTHNEIECFNPTIKGLFAKVSSIEECPKEFLEFAAKYDLPIILMAPSDLEN